MSRGTSSGLRAGAASNQAGRSSRDGDARGGDRHRRSPRHPHKGARGEADRRPSLQLGGDRLNVPQVTVDRPSLLRKRLVQPRPELLDTPRHEKRHVVEQHLVKAIRILLAISQIHTERFQDRTNSRMSAAPRRALTLERERRSTEPRRSDSEAYSGDGAEPPGSSAVRPTTEPSRRRSSRGASASRAGTPRCLARRPPSIAAAR